MTSNLSAFAYIGERSEATPGLFNLPLSILSANIAAVDQTLSLGQFQQLSIGSTPPSYLTTAAVTIEVNSNQSDYLYMVDSSGQRSSYIIGSRAGGTADGLNIWDASAGTMLASFSKQSIRFYQNVVGPSFDLGGAVFNVRAFGALGDGITDDTNAIQAGIETAAFVGGTLLFSRGTYLVGNSGTSGTYSLSCNTALKIVGDGAATVKLRTGMAAGSEILRINTTPSTISVADVEIDSLNFDGSGQSRMYGVRALYTNRLVINNCQFTEFFHKALAAPGYCLYLSGSTTSTLATGFSWTTVTPTGWAKQTRITGCQFNSRTSGSGGTLGAHGVFLYYTDGAVVSQNVFDTLAIPLVAYGWCRQIALTNNVVANSTDDGIRFEADESLPNARPTDMEGVICTGNAIKNSFKDGIRCSANRSVVANNISESNALGGITAVVLRNSIIANNECYDNTNRGIYLTTTTLSGWSTHDNILISGNFCQNNGVAGIDVVGGGDLLTVPATNIQVSNNLCQGNGSAGIRLYDCDGGRVLENISVSNNTSDVSSNGYGLEIKANNIAAGVGNCLVSGNRIYDQRAASSALQNVSVIIWAAGGKTLNSNQFYYNDVSGTSSNGSFTARGFWTTAGGGTVNGQLFVGNRVGTAGTPWAIASTDTVVTHSLLGPIQYATGTAILPSMAYSSESSLGWYRSGASAMGLSYGQLALPIGSAITPSLGFSSETSLGWYRSAASNMALSYGELIVPNGTATQPGIGFASEISLGFYRSGASKIVQNYGQFIIQGGSATTPSIAVSSNFSLGIYSPNAQTISLSSGTFNLALNGIRFSMRTLAASGVTASAVNTNVAVNEVVFTIGGASGASLIISSGGTAYIFASTSSAILA